MLSDTQIPAPRVAITDKAPPTREWFRFFNSLYNFIGLGTGAVPTTSGGTGIVTYETGDLLYASAPDVLTRLPVPGSPSYLGTDGTNMPQWIRVAYGAFTSLTTQTAAANTPTRVNIATTELTRNITLAANRVTVENQGVYTIIFSAQLTNPQTTADDDIFMWIRVNGVDVPDSASRVTVVKSHGGTAGNFILTVNFFYTFAAGDYLELYWLSLAGSAQITTFSASTSPAAPGIILTVSQVV